LHYVSDRTGWWNLYGEGERDPEAARPLHEMEAEFTGPDWIFGQCSYGFLDEERIAVAWSRDAIDHLGVLAKSSGELTEWEAPYTSVGSLRPYGKGVVAVVASAT